jgi:oligopeptide/dipeptide ABC transporter ATP-binding protein
MTALLSVEGLSVRFRGPQGSVHAVRGASFDVRPGETVGLVGESGSGKSVTSLAVMGLLPRASATVDGGRIMLAGTDLLTLPPRELRRRRGGELAMVFQDPMTSLNPVRKIGGQIIEALRAHEKLSVGKAERAAAELLDRVGIADAKRVLRQHPFSLSGGMRQRVMIAIALALKPRLLIADEPTTALDVTIQAQVLEVLRELTRELGTGVVLITHDLGVVAAMAQRVHVMYAGAVVESAPTPALFAAPRHPYTVGLMRSVPRSDRDGAPVVPIPGQPPDLAREWPGCAFAPRCAWRLETCWTSAPPLAGPAAHQFACHHPAQPQELIAGAPQDHVAAPEPQEVTGVRRAAA